jgi:predicted amidohydrolase YtcJ
MTRWVFDGVALPDGEALRPELGSGESQPLPGRFALPGLVDSHCHLTVGQDEIGLPNPNSPRISPVIR